MYSELPSNNLFKYATSELSQDAFLSWLLSFAMEENKNVDAALCNCARDFIHRFYNIGQNEYVTGIQRQHLKIDVLVEIGDIRVIIEDKTYTDVHGNQIEVYKNALIAEGIPEEKIISVFYKIADQPRPENYAVNIFRKDMLDICSPYYELTSNVIFRNYVDYVRNIEESSLSYTTEPIEKWRQYNGAYEAFFKKITNDGTIHPSDTDSWNWGYVPNQAGGFMCLWWQPLKESQKKSFGIQEYFSDIYLEIEDSIITVKLSTDGIVEKENKAETIRSIRWAIYEQMKEALSAKGICYEKGRFQPGVHMSAGFLKYDYSNYKEQIKQVEECLICVVGQYRYTDGQGFINRSI